MDFCTFLISAIILSLSGVMSPGPLFAVTISKSFKDKMAGLLISFGHGLIEFPLMFLVYFGLSSFLEEKSPAHRIISFVGGLILILMGVQMLRTQKGNNKETSYFKYGPLVSGILATGSNPYFLLWWATVGTDLVINAAFFGFIGFLVFAVIHWSCDLFWNTFVSITVFKSQRFWTKTVRKIIFGFCVIVFIGFGAWFIISALL